MKITRYDLPQRLLTNTPFTKIGNTCKVPMVPHNIPLQITKTYTPTIITFNNKSLKALQDSTVIVPLITAQNCALFYTAPQIIQSCNSLSCYHTPYITHTMFYYCNDKITMETKDLFELAYRDVLFE